MHSCPFVVHLPPPLPVTSTGGPVQKGVRFCIPSEKGVGKRALKGYVAPMNTRTPLYENHVSLGARMAPFAGWDMPIQYAGIVAEHLHTRREASLFDTCHMGEFEIGGPTAESDLERLLTQRIATIKDHQCRYGFLLNEDGGVLDDLTCYRLAPDRFLLVVNAGTLDSDAAWIKAHLSHTTSFTDRSSDTAKLDVQGPTARASLESAFGLSVPNLKFFYATEWDMDGVPCLMSRTGYTGEWGYELYFDAAQAGAIWERLLAPGVIQPAGLGARDTLRLEVGYPLYGHELGPDRTPVAVTNGLFMDVEKAFIGREAVLRDLEQGVAQKLVGLSLDSKRAARTGDPVCLADEVVGSITSGSMAPSLGAAVALAYVRSDLAEPGQTLEAETRGRRLSARVTELPFYKDGTARKK